MEVTIAAPAKVPLLPIANIIEGILFVAVLGGHWHRRRRVMLLSTMNHGARGCGSEGVHCNMRVFFVVSNGEAYPR